MKQHKHDYIIIAISMDDFLTAASTPYMNDQLYTTLKTKYEIKRLGKPTAYLNWQVTHHPEYIHLSQPNYIKHVVQDLRLTESNPKDTP